MKTPGGTTETNRDDATNEAESDSTLAASVHLRAEIDVFCRDMRLTPRETDVVHVLAEGVVRIKDIADRLKLSPNTVNNHVNSIFLKTGMRSKSQLLASLLNRIAQDLHVARWMRQSPRVLAIGPMAREISVALEARRFKVRSVDVDRATGSDFESDIADFRPHYVLVDAPSDVRQREDWRALAEKTTKSIGRSQIVFVAGELIDSETRCYAMAAGALDVLKANVDPAEVVRLFVSHFIEDDADRVRYLEVELASGAGAELAVGSAANNARQRAATFWKAGKSEVSAIEENFGNGGIFVPMAELEKAFSNVIVEGDWVEFPLRLSSGQTIPIRGRVAWVRNQGSATGSPGAGIRIVAPFEPIRSLFRTFKNRLMTAYIPDGIALA